MKKLIVFSVMFVMCMSIILTGCRNNTRQSAPEIVKPAQGQLIQRGEYLVTTMGCNDCHSPKKMGPQGPMLITELILSGYPSDRPLLPPMPWANFINISDEDISAIFAYLKNTKPVRNVVPMAISPDEMK